MLAHISTSQVAAHIGILLLLGSSFKLRYKVGRRPEKDRALPARIDILVSSRSRGPAAAQ
ncbi:uncharacterized protein LY89DRAFT_127244 [Mollisia scopiformis]|uniref:Uncharacterized protein n=1 Tax=Mollisia scopiformis TaxID=149040 RepID=A0A194X476_MOLSC|nr:uncharacterized protein LY89DRAFT_127244 [Mollisia scopiformis]KUJ14983.1 hypothetical protein LY89DRAFT_127244 [Mollisia scopiformis]